MVVAAPPAAATPWSVELGPVFAAELRRRLPRLVASTGRLRRRGTAATAATVRAVVADTHALASSAVVVGEHAAARAARACEQGLLAYADTGRPPHDVVAGALSQLEVLLAELGRWSAAAPAAWGAPTVGPAAGRALATPTVDR